MLENRNNNRKTGQKGQVKKGFRQEQHSNVNLLEQNGDLAEDYYFKLSKFAGNKTVQRMVEDGSMFNHQQRESTVDMKGLTQRKVKEVNNYVPPKKVAPKNYVKKSSSTNKTGLPDQLRSGIENLANMDLSDIRVHYNSKKPKDINAHAFTQGSEIHVAPGQEKHLAHEAWHVVQQKQGRVKPTTQVSGVNVNDNKHLEREADVMGAKALKSGGKGEGKKPIVGKSKPVAKSGKRAVQRKTKNLNGLPREVLSSKSVDSNVTNKINTSISKYNKIDVEDKDFSEHKGTLKYIMDLFGKLKPKSGKEKSSSQSKPKAVKNQKGKKGKKGNSSTRGKSKPVAEKPEKIDVSDNKKEVDEEFKAVEGQIRSEAIIQEEIAKRKEAEAQEAAAKAEEKKANANAQEKGGAKKNGSKEQAAPEGEKVNKAEEKAKMQDEAKDKPEGKTQKKNKEQQKKEQQENAVEKKKEDEEKKLKKKEEEAQQQEALASKEKGAEKGGGEQDAAAAEKDKTKKSAIEAEKKKDLAAEKDKKKNKDKEDQKAEEQKKKNEQENASKENEVNKNKDNKKESATAKEQKAASEQQKKQDKDNIKEKKAEQEAVAKKKEEQEKAEQEKKNAEKRGEKPPFSRVRQLAAGQQFKSLLKLYGYNWFTAKKHLTTATFAKDKNEYYEREGVMAKLVDFRKGVAEDLIKETISKGAKVLVNKVGSEQGLSGSPSISNREAEVSGKTIIKGIELGSKAITSDLDYSFSAPGNEDFEVNLVKIFNGLFRKRWGTSSGVMFDVNAYTFGFMSKAAGKDKEDAEKNAELLGEEHFKGAVRSNEKTQLALGLLPVREFFGKKVRGWDKFSKDTSRELQDVLRATKIKKDARNIITGTLSGVFKQTERLYKETSQAMEKELEGTKRPDGNLSQEHVKAVASDKLYEKQLTVVKSLLSERKRLTKDISVIMKQKSSGKLDSSSVSKLENLRKDLSNNMKRFDVEQGKALVYANEAYYNAGAATHVVKGMQGGGDSKLGQQELMESLLMNVGYKLQHFKHNLEEEGTGNALVSTSKYGQRIDNALQQLGTVDNQLEEDKEMLENELDLLNNYKKSSQFSAQPARESEAEKSYGENMSSERVNEGYLRIARNNLVSFYVSKVESVTKKK